MAEIGRFPPMASIVARESPSLPYMTMILSSVGMESAKSFTFS